MAALNNIYSKQLFATKNGYPIYNPSARPAGDNKQKFDFVRVGDVGWIEKGGFRRAFNVLEGEKSAVNGKGVPAGFEVCGGESVQETTIPPGVLASSRVRSSISGQGLPASNTAIADGATIELECTAGPASALIFKHPVYREDISSRRIFFHYMLKHYKSWFAFIRTAFDKDLALSDLVFITGCDLTADWAIATFPSCPPSSSNSGCQKVSFVLDNQEATPTEEGGAKTTLWGSWKPDATASDSNSTSTTCDLKCGPTIPIISPPESSQASLNIDAFEYPKFDQCIFIRSYRLRERPQSSSSPSTSSSSSSSAVSLTLQHAAGGHSNNPVSLNNQSTTYNTESSIVPPRPHLTHPPEHLKQYNSSTSTVSSIKSPSLHDVVFEYIFKTTDVDVALVHDDDIPILFTPSMCDSETPDMSQISSDVKVLVERYGSLSFGRIDASYHRSPEPEFADEDFFLAAAVPEVAGQLMNVHLSGKLNNGDSSKPTTSSSSDQEDNYASFIPGTATLAQSISHPSDASISASSSTSIPTSYGRSSSNSANSTSTAQTSPSSMPMEIPPHPSSSVLPTERTPAIPIPSHKVSSSTDAGPSSSLFSSSSFPESDSPPEFTMELAKEIDPYAQHDLHHNRDQTSASKSKCTGPGCTGSSNGFNCSNDSSTTDPPVPGHSRAQMHVKIFQARNLNIQWAKARPYAIVQCEQNEFVGSEAISFSDADDAYNAKLAEERKTKDEAANSSEPMEQKGADEEVKDTDVVSISSESTVAPDSGNVPVVSEETGKVYRDPVWNIELSCDIISDLTYVTVHLYDRTPEPEAFLGRATIKPVFQHKHTTDQYYELMSYGQEDIKGEIRVAVTYELLERKRPLSVDDFEFLKLIGRGTYGRVFQVRKKDSQRIYAIKVMSIKEIVARKEVAHTIGELKTLRRSQHCPFLVGLTFAFRTNGYLHLVTDFKTGGELFWHLQKDVRLSEERAKFYVAEIVLALEHLHKYDIVYRDLKPENILLDAIGHIALCDFGLSKPGLSADQLTTTLCGTTEYLAPEMLLDNNGYSLVVDFWSLGVLLFEMLCGWSPFYAEDTQEMYRNICFGKIKFPKGVISDNGKQFVKKLLHRNPRQRLGAQHDTAELKAHPFFAGMDWEALLLRQILPPFKPKVDSDASVFNFDPQFTTADIQEIEREDVDVDLNGFLFRVGDGDGSEGDGTGRRTGMMSSGGAEGLSGGSILMTPIGELRRDLGSGLTATESVEPEGE